ncbi:MAG: helix-turn-helix domain-containing protein [Pseudomonadota bacterium]
MQIVTTAAHMFASEGFDRASMNQIAAACGISKADNYLYSQIKYALLFDLMDIYL